MAKRHLDLFLPCDVQKLLTAPNELYEAPYFPIELPTFDEYKDNPPKFGEEMRRKHFFLEPEVTYLNHGAFGSVLSESLETCQKYQRYTERQPLRFLDRELFPLLVYVFRELAKYVGCDPCDIVLVNNASTATASVVRGIPFTKDDTIFFLSTTYVAVKNLLTEVSRQTGVHLQEEMLPLPITGKEQILKLVRDKLKPGTRLAIFDHISSDVPLIMPLKEIIEICHEKKVEVYIDGAHALGSRTLNMHSLRPTYYTSNAHKWLSAPKGCAFMYIDKSRHATVRPCSISHGYGAGMNSEFIWTGSQDCSNFLSILVNLKFWQTVGEDRIYSYMRSLTKQAVELLTEKWSTSPVVPPDMFGSMALVPLPDSIHPSPPPSTKVDVPCARLIQNELFHKYDIEVPVKALEGRLYLRISCHIYNELSEYNKLAEAILEIAAAWKKKEQLE